MFTQQTHLYTEKRRQLTLLQNTPHNLLQSTPASRVRDTDSKLSCQHSKATIQLQLHGTPTSRMRHTDSNFSLKRLHCIATVQLRLHSTPTFKLREIVNSLTKDPTTQLQFSMSTQYTHLPLRNIERQKTALHRSNILQSTPTSKPRDTDSHFSYKRLHCLATIYCTAHPPLN